MKCVIGKTLALLALIGLPATAARAAIVYQWTDANGTVHFGDAPPAHGAQVKAEELPDAPTPAPASAPAGDQSRDGPPPAGAIPQGPAHVALFDQKAEAVSADVQSFSGKVKNEGGVEARDVFIDITVTEPAQGAECLHDRIDVQPSTLAPGAEATFEAQFQNPCFNGQTQADLHAEWR